MKRFLAFSNGLIVGVMVLFNGMLALRFGNYLSLVIIYGFGVIIGLFMLIMKRDLKSIFKGLPRYLLFSGVLGVLNIFLNNVCVNNIGVSLTLALCLAGQIIFSAVFEHYGFFGVIKKKLSFQKLPGYLLIAAGVAVMIVMGV